MLRQSVDSSYFSFIDFFFQYGQASITFGRQNTAIRRVGHPNPIIKNIWEKLSY
ncbi:predicted protein [Neisseria gonorrhoeae PID1]|nr:predicted protein [Neisseria gonorrhoeae PID1]